MIPGLKHAETPDRGDQLGSVLWVTNLAAPYRLPVWKEISKQWRLSVALLESNESLRRDTTANRGQDWLRPTKGNVHFIELPTWKLSLGESRFYTLRSLGSLAAVRKYDVVLFGGWESPAYWMLLAASFLFGTTRVGFYESTTATMKYRSGFFARMREVFFRCMQVVVVPGIAAEDAITELGVPGTRIRRGFNAVDVSRFHSASMTTALEAAATRTQTDGHRYLYVGQLIGRKRVDSVIASFLEIAETGDQLTIVGTGELMEELRSLHKEILPTITFLGHVDNDRMPALMANHDTLVLASEQEVWGLVVNEALASGMQVVVTGNCGVAPSIAEMEGVLIASSRLCDLPELMRQSKTVWSGRIVRPEILNYTPELFAQVFSDAFLQALNAAPRLDSSWRREFSAHDN